MHELHETWWSFSFATRGQCLPQNTRTLSRGICRHFYTFTQNAPCEHMLQLCTEPKPCPLHMGQGDDITYHDPKTSTVPNPYLHYRNFPFQNANRRPLISIYLFNSNEVKDVCLMLEVCFFPSRLVHKAVWVRWGAGGVERARGAERAVCVTEGETESDSRAREPVRAALTTDRRVPQSFNGFYRKAGVGKR